MQITYFLPALVLALMGWLVKYKKQAWLISGYNTASRSVKDSYDIEKLTRIVGNFIFILAGIFALTAATALVFPTRISQVFMVGMGVFMLTVVAGLIYLNTGSRLKKS